MRAWLRPYGPESQEFIHHNYVHAGMALPLQNLCRNINLPHIILGVSDIPVIDKEVDAAGLKCPEPVMMLHNALANLDKGKVVLMKATDPTTIRDVRNFCTYLGHELIHQDEDNGVFSW